MNKIDKDDQKNRKVLVIGIDGADFQLLEHLINEGKLPTMKKLMEKGVSGVLKSTIPSETCPALPAMYTGKNPGNIGIFGFLKNDGGVVTSLDIHHNTIWQIASKNNKKSCIVNLRTTYPPEKINGVMICGIHGAEYKDYLKNYYTYPPGLQQQIEGFTIPYEDYLKNIKYNLVTGKQEGVEYTINLEKFRYKIFKDLLKKDNYDFSFYWLEHSDTLHHLGWKKKKFIPQFYQEVDKILDDVLRSFRDYNILIVSDHGVAKPIHNYFYINNWLQEEGYLISKKGKIRRTILQIGLELIPLITNMFPKKELYPFKAKFRGMIDKITKGKNKIEKKGILGSEWGFFGVDIEYSVAYSDIKWGIHTQKKNMKGGDYEKIRGDIIEKLKKIKNGDGGKVVKGAWRREEIFCGKYLEEIPDIVFLLNEGYKARSTVTNRTISKLSFVANIAEHPYAQNGIFIAYGPDMKNNVKIDDIKIYDIAPTVLHMIGLKIPMDMDGKVIKEIFRENSEPAKRDVEFIEETAPEKMEGRLTKEDEEIIKKRLRALGYID